jgi:hypothetical protein
MGKMPVFRERQKHIPIRVCHLKECCDEGIVELRHIGTKYQLADIGTKALPAPAFLPLRDVILGKVSFSDLQGPSNRKEGCENVTFCTGETSSQK